MTRPSKTALALSSFFAFAGLAITGSTASADRVSFGIGGSVHIGVSGSVTTSPRPVVAHFPRYGGHVHVRVGCVDPCGVRFAEPPPPPPPPSCEVGCATVPSYYVEPPPPAPAPITVYAPQPRPAPPRWGVGVFAGSVDVDGREAGTDLGLLGRFVLSRSFQLEAEVARSQLEDGSRIDRRIGGALLFDLRPEHRWAPYILGGVGYGQANWDAAELHARQGYGELGLGLTYRASERVHLVGDVRLGRRHTTGEAALKAPTPVSIDEREDYTRGRIGALLYF